jgi:hypothetical protein
MDKLNLLLKTRPHLLDFNIMSAIISCGQFGIWKLVAHRCLEVKLELLSPAVRLGRVEIVEDLTKRYPAIVRECGDDKFSIFRYVSEASGEARDKIRNMFVPAVIKDTKVSMAELSE